MDPPSRSSSRGLERPHWAGLGGSASRKSRRDFRGPPKGRVAWVPQPCPLPGATPGVGDWRGGASALLTALPRDSDAPAVGAGPGRPRLGVRGGRKGAWAGHSLRGPLPGGRARGALQRVRGGAEQPLTWSRAAGPRGEAATVRRASVRE